MTVRHLPTVPLSILLPTLLLCGISAPSYGQVVCDDQGTSAAREFFSTPDITMSLIVDDGEGEASETVAHCARRCRRSARCLSFTYSNQTCLLHPHDSTTAPEFKHEATNTWFYENVDKSTADRSEYFRGCLRNYNKCQNGGSCKSDCSPQGYYCACPDNYRGDACQFAREDEPVLVQTIEGAGSHGCAGFTFGNEHLLVIGGYVDSDVSGTDSEATTRVFKYNETMGRYEYSHDLAGLSQATRITPMTIAGQQFVFAANYQTFGGSRTVDSVLYVYVNGTFRSHQTMTTYGAWESAYLLSTTGQRYMFIANFRGDGYNVNSPIYKWYGEYDRFYFVQNVATQGAGAPVLFDVAGVAYMVVPFHYGDHSGYSVQPELWKRSDSSFIYMGCYLDGDVRAMTFEFSSDSMTIETCVIHCRRRGHPYAGLQYASQCYCGDEGYSIHGLRSDGECGSTCSGNGGQYCGASYRNSVYMTEPSWSKIQTLPDATATIAAAHVHHEGSDYLVLAPYTDGSSCDHNLVMYVWNGDTEEFETHQKILEAQCVIELEFFKANGRAFLITGISKTKHSDSDNRDYTVSNIIYRLEGTMLVPYWSLEGRSTYDWAVFQRNGETYLAQSNLRSTNASTYDRAELNIYQWY